MFRIVSKMGTIGDDSICVLPKVNGVSNCLAFDWLCLCSAHGFSARCAGYLNERVQASTCRQDGNTSKKEHLSLKDVSLGYFYQHGK